MVCRCWCAWCIVCIDLKDEWGSGAFALHVHVEQKNLFAFIIERSLYRKFSAASNVFMAQFGDNNIKAFYQSN